ncbi:aminodeoxychorismate lyase [candidate division LCP-89 bacterium B3_LCP]|uniref:Endolytic murein transglycosylase n=1 Tax=candidate division LCP-89 bacterium B3_LCP TaxID=2012998 RepID=A0A532UUH6_UNCL8|nr:MAG: aminodeoxychorismate lyase [candidate division LCP-89 bacterium B3_LCP]
MPNYPILKFLMKFDLKTPLIIAIICAAMLLGVVTGRTYNAIYGHNETIGDGIYAIIHVNPGMTVLDVAHLLKESGLINSTKDFTFSAKFLKFEQSIQTGEYALPYGQSNCALLSRLVNAGSAANLIAIPEGYTARQIALLLSREIDLDTSAFMYAIRDTSLLNKYGIEAPSFEGFLFPDSYNFYRSISASWIVDKMVSRFFEVFDSAMKARIEHYEFTMIEAITLASIIQGEMIHQSEAPLISAVYHNRLKRKMRLQADPTIQYLIPNSPRRLWQRDLEIDSPYNTYKYRGLPPGPVCNPGRRALEAALNPADKPYLYLVAKGNGEHAFNFDFAGHLKDKAKLDSLRAAIKRTQRSFIAGETKDPSR